MNGETNLIAGLIQKFNNETEELTNDELAYLEQWMSEDPSNEVLFRQLTNKYSREKGLAKLMESKKRTYAQVIDRIDEAKTKKVFPISYKRFIAVAAAILLVVVSTWFLVTNKREKAAFADKTSEKNDQQILPGNNKAVLTRGDGTTVILDSSLTGVVSQEGSATVLQQKVGQLQYKVAKENQPAVFNTVRTGKGSTYRIQLPDGSIALLNAGSSLRFPTFFNEGKREVELKGEGWFEIVKNEQQPFIVHSGATAITVLGTKFNLNHYESGIESFCSLVEGRVVVKTKNAWSELKPGQKSVVNEVLGSITIRPADLESELSWIENKFYFENATIDKICKQLEVWYDVEFTFDANLKPEHINMISSRSISLKELLERISMAAGYHFTFIDQKTIRVSR